MNDIIPLALDHADEVWTKIAVSNNAIMPMFSFQWYRTWLSVNTDWQPYPLLIRNTTIAPFVRKGSLVQFAHAYTDFNDLIGPADVWPAVLEYIKQDGITHLEFENIPEASDTVTFFKNAPPLKTVTVTDAKTAPFITLPATFDAYLATIKPKRRKYHKFQNEYPQATVVRSNEPEKDIGILIELLKLNPIKLASLTTPKETFFRGIAASCKQHVWLQLLKLDDEVISILYMFTHGKKLMVYNSGFDKDRYPNAGTYIMIETIKQAIEQQYNEFNLLIGREQYKYEMGAQDSALYTVVGEL